ncbi:MAG: HD domain-containing protein [Gammaproteobacteria bacterium]|nr:HD domain-containing protein [Gammaproteobacteria bacterium]MDH5594173.1 HD domain-containing protein [Gammaproteobacteria bacterium]MDH5614048.1 HD domain-containing protein [Gammaproteobacteria bacterium]
MSIFKISSSEIQIGKPLSWTVYDANGKVLLKMGTVINSQRQLEALLARGLYRSGKPASEAPQKKKKLVDDNSSPFDLFNDIAFRLKHVFEGILRQDKETPKRIVRLCRDIQELCEFDVDAALGAVHVVHGHPYTIYHPLHIAVVCEIIGQALKQPANERLPIIAAALTGNIAMNELQELLQQQSSPLTEEQRSEINTHPRKSVEMLEAVGVNDKIWLDGVLQHHEMIDGSGYPDGITDKDISLGAKIIAVADKYSALLSPRAYRESLTAQEALRQFFVEKGQQYDEKLSMLFIKELGIFPPGAFVKLKNGEIAIVIKRGDNTLFPIVCSYIADDGSSYSTPMKRDTNIKEFGIDSVSEPDKRIPLNLRVLWGYS